MQNVQIGFDGRHFTGMGGIDRYSRELLKALSKECSDCMFHLFTIRRKEKHFYPLFTDNRNIYIKAGFLHHFMLGNQLEPFLRSLNDKYLFRRSMSKCDIYHCTNPFFYCRGSIPSVITIHDMFPFYDEEWTHSFLGNASESIRKIFREGIMESKAIITPTFFVKKELLNFFPDIPSEKVFVTHEAGNFPVCNNPTTLAKYNISESDIYFFHVGRFDPRKNLLAILDAFALLRSSLPESEKSKVRFVYAGTVSKSDEEKLVKKVNSLNLGNSFIHIQGPSDEEVSTLFINARCFIFPSFAEGFGLPVLEAMQCGCPVITSNTSCLPEIAGEAALYVNPYDINEICTAMNTILHSRSLQDELREKGYIQCKKFSWESCARGTMKAYSFALNQ